MRTLLICHAGAELHEDGLARWLASFSTVAGVLVIHEDRGVLRRRVARELRRVGLLRFLDIMAFRLYYRVRLAGRDRAWKRHRLETLQATYPPPPEGTPVAHERSPNNAASERFIAECRPDIILALCKNILAERIFTIARVGTFVLHPGVCPEYRNAHGCFWALAAGELDKVGMTLLRIDRGVDTGPVFGYFSYPYDEVRESHIVIQDRVVFDNLDAIRDALIEIEAGTRPTIDTTGRRSAVWGQPWLTSFLGWKRAARRRQRAHDRARVP